MKTRDALALILAAAEDRLRPTGVPDREEATMFWVGTMGRWVLREDLEAAARRVSQFIEHGRIGGE